MISKSEIDKMIDEKLTLQEKEYYKKYLEYTFIRIHFDIVYFLKNKNQFFKHMK